MTEDRLEALLLLQCHREHCPTNDVLSALFCQESHMTQLCSIAEIAEVCEVKCRMSIYISAAFRLLFIYIYFALRFKAEL